MNNQEAIENLKYLISSDCCDDQMDYVEEIGMAIEALEEQVIQSCSCCQDGVYYDVLGSICKYSFCPMCGYKLEELEGIE